MVEEWLEAVNRADGRRLEELTHQQVEIVGPRSSATTDRGVLSEWLTRSGFSAETLRWFCGADGDVVVEQDARWVDTATGVEQGRARLASQFVVRGAQVAKYVRHDEGLASALAAAALAESDEVTGRTAT